MRAEQEGKRDRGKAWDASSGVFLLFPDIRASVVSCGQCAGDIRESL